MAVEKKDKKRKAAVTSTQTPADPPSKKSKKSASKPAKVQVDVPKPILKKPKSDAPKSVPVSVTSEPARQIRPRKRAADFLSDDEEEKGDLEKSKKKLPVTLSPAAAKSTSAEADKPSKKKSKKGAEVLKSSAPPAKDAATKADSGKEASNSSKSSKKPKDTRPPFQEMPNKIEEDANDGSEGEEGDDQTAALIQGFESSGDEDISADEGFEPGTEVPAIPDAKQMKRKLRKIKKKSGTETEEPGTVYVGRVPHGFYEHEMRAYFSQFGPITQLRLSRNRTTGRSKHFAFIEFASASVAQVVADTMDNYLMFGHIMKCKYIPKESVHPQLWKGANKRFKRTPWNAIERRRMDAGKTREQWSKKIEQEEARRAARAEKMKELGYEFEMPALKGVDEVPVAIPAAPPVDGEGKQGAISSVENGESTKEQKQPAAIEAPAKEADKPNGPDAEAETTPKNAKEKKVKKDKKDTPVKEAKTTGEKDKKKEGKSTSKKEKAVTDTPEKPGKSEKSKASPAAAGKLEKKGEKSKVKKSKA
ncbi:hypothetical protein AJ78_07522 [Emergomyces pasteurianus Ep9510]|uniref:RRM domain-containing protein n=1 Tax=Emergomyces pasteurianus Ep9510 TaxID=1447872 RepID=A0A1J9P4Z3_9EURO|nr:hypothetical protein AJ78_07522 [Emergomyces pasteurianus Ep9510]